MGAQELMGVREAERAATMCELVSGRLRQGRAARRLGLSVRQVKRLLRRYRQDGAAGLASRKRRRASNRKLPGAVHERALALVAERGPRILASPSGDGGRRGRLRAGQIICSKTGQFYLLLTWQQQGHF